MLAYDLRADLEAENKRCKLLDAQVEGLEKDKKALLESNAKDLQEYKDTIAMCFYMF